MTYHKAARLAGLGMIVIMLGGCSFSHQTMPGSGLWGLGMEELCRQDYTVLETVEGSGTVTRILGFDTGDSQFGYVGRAGPDSGGGFLEAWRLFLSFFFGPPRDAGAAAAYDAMSKIPQADTFLPMTRTISTSGLPGIFGNIYSVQQATVRGKSIQIRSGDGSKCPVRTSIKIK